MLIPWTHCRFQQPPTLTPHEFLQARSSSAAFRQRYRAALAGPFKATLIRVAGIAAVTLVGVWWGSVADERSGPDLSVVELLAVTLGSGLLVSLILSTVSFGIFAAKHTIYWERMLGVARRQGDMELFLRELRARHLLDDDEIRRPFRFGFVLLIIALVGAGLAIVVMPQR